ncbi:MULTISPECIES: dihydropteroate synthase [Inquilinus]|uniref:dihydropteroate synthase n=1 Tax=Inquilinus ginsengisoli TaxID=363840 RepID=A0ABU1JMJ6_9PROT|nr:dihydropteroate synthase [Inquilinus ginsengisoli]MDR6289841.1 dihydropteroate synthase [Inquilinus ginsengisoli]
MKTPDRDPGPRFDAARAVFLSDDFAPWASRPRVRPYLRPLSLADHAPGALPLAGGPLSFDRVELILRDGAGQSERAVADLATLRRWAGLRGLDAAIAERLDRLSRPRPAFAGLALDRPRLMGIVNVTPDSFSDGGDFADAGRAVAHGLAMAEAGAEILDVGGESTRPGSATVSPDQEIARIEPVVRDLANRGLTVSIDTRHAVVMAAALAAGARIVNDVTGLTGDAESLGFVARAGCPVALMHIRGEPRTMQDDPVYDDVLLDVHDWLEARVAACVAAGIPAGRIAIDPGIGFGKRPLAHNLPLLRGLSLLHGLGCPILLGVSRKRFIGSLSGAEEPKARGPGSIAAGLYGIAQGVQILRVHDVGETHQALAVWSALQAGVN